MLLFSVEELISRCKCALNIQKMFPGSSLIHKLQKLKVQVQVGLKQVQVQVGLKFNSYSYLQGRWLIISAWPRGTIMFCPQKSFNKQN